MAEGEGIEAVKESSRRRPRRIASSGRRLLAAIETEIGLGDLRAAQRAEFALLQHAQESGLQIDRHLRDLVEEKRAFRRRVKHAGKILARAGERALLIAEELALDHVLRERPRS